jgi:hypothetical protein
MPATYYDRPESRDQGVEFIQLATQHMTLAEAVEYLGEDGTMAHWAPLTRLRMVGDIMLGMPGASSYEHWVFQPGALRSGLFYPSPQEPASWAGEEWDIANHPPIRVGEAAPGWHEDALRWLCQLPCSIERRYTPNAADLGFARTLLALALACLPGDAPWGAALDGGAFTGRYYCCGADGFLIASGDQALVMIHGHFC